MRYMVKVHGVRLTGYRMTKSKIFSSLAYQDSLNKHFIARSILIYYTILVQFVAFSIHILICWCAGLDGNGFNF